VRATRTPARVNVNTASSYTSTSIDAGKKSSGGVTLKRLSNSLGGNRMVITTPALINANRDANNHVSSPMMTNLNPNSYTITTQMAMLEIGHVYLENRSVLDVWSLTDCKRITALT
jgi:hypothetical protein